MDRIMPLDEWIVQTYGELPKGSTSRYLCGTEIQEVRYDRDGLFWGDWHDRQQWLIGCCWC
jgi:hypothetical protein